MSSSICRTSSFGANGPGGGEIFMRGLQPGRPPASSPAPTSCPSRTSPCTWTTSRHSSPGRNLDIYMADMERIEVLEGPQGTLFGGGAEAGAIRYITNKPNLTTTSGIVSAMYGITAHGDPNQSIQAMLNVPVIEGTFAPARGDLRRASRRLHRQRAQHLHPQHQPTPAAWDLMPLSGVRQRAMAATSTTVCSGHPGQQYSTGQRRTRRPTAASA